MHSTILVAYFIISH